MRYVEVDGSIGEGGGQILRTAVAFSAIQKRPVRITNVRAGREVPGLKRQHVSALEILSGVFGGRLEGAEVGSTEVKFIPGSPTGGFFSVDTGTAASITLILQAVVPAVALAESRLELMLTGGTDVPWSPTFDYFHEVVRPAFAAIGINFNITAETRGYYPRGGGRVKVVVEPCRAVLPLALATRPSLSSATLVSRCANLPRSVAQRQEAASAGRLREAGLSVGEEVITEERALSPGSSVLICASTRGSFLGSDSIGAKGKPAEDVGVEAAMSFLTSVESGACLDSNIADMVIPLLALAGSPSTVTVARVTPHLESGLRLAEQFTGCSHSTTKEGKCFVVRVFPAEGQDGSAQHNV